MTKHIQCDHITEATRPDTVGIVVDKENNKAIIVDIASPWDHRVYEKEGENIVKYQDLKREIRRRRGIRHLEVVPVVVGELGVVSKKLDAWLEKLGVTIRTRLLQKTALLGKATVSVTNVVTHIITFAPSPHSMLRSHSCLCIGVQKATGRSNIEGRAEERNIN